MTDAFPLPDASADLTGEVALVTGGVDQAEAAFGLVPILVNDAGMPDARRPQDDSVRVRSPPRWRRCGH